MSSIWAGILIIIISLLYNYLSQQLINVILNEGSDIDIKNKIGIFIFCGIIGLVCANMIKDNNSIISNGMMFGSYIMLVDIVTSNWTEMDDKLKLFVTLVCFIKIILYANKIDKNGKKKETHGKTRKI